jgi:superfamily II DNA or RNA helicase
MKAGSCTVFMSQRDIFSTVLCVETHLYRAGSVGDEGQRMSFRELLLKGEYSSFEEDLLDDFYIPVLSCAVAYDRLSGFFSSTALAVAAEGIYEFLHNDGKMRLIVGSKLTQADVDAITKGETEKSTLIARDWEKELDKFPNDIVRDHVRALAWLVAHNRLEIRIAFVLDELGRPIPSDSAEALFHMKVGVLTDGKGNRLSFSGSINETAAGWERNYEEFKVFRDWLVADISRVESDFARFGRCWKGKAPHLALETVPEAVRKKLIVLAPSDLSELRSLKRTARLRLREYQTDAVDAWFENGCKGILAMATGTGKTITALGCIRRLLEETATLAVVVTVPTVHLLNQWKKTLEKHEFQVVTAWGSPRKWRNAVANRLMDLQLGAVNCVIVLVTDSTFWRNSFTSLFESEDVRSMLIGDEAHGLGSTKRMMGLLSTYRYRLGLTATPKRHFDEEGTEAIMDFFGGIVYEFDISGAIKSGFLSPYRYSLHFVGLNVEEKRKYRELTKKVAQAYHASKNNEDRSKAFELFSIQRRNIVVNARSKYAALDAIMKEIGEPKHMLIYCSPQQIDEVQTQLGRKRPPIIQSRFTARESPEMRQLLLQSFANGMHEVLVAMRCLDEGVDLPATRTAIFMASSTNPRQFIQRRGRILRPHKGKEYAIVHDLVVIPSEKSDAQSEVFEMEKSIMASELRRSYEFARHAMNDKEAMKVIREYAARYDIAVGEEK